MMKYLKILIVFIISIFIFSNGVYASKADTLAGLRAELNILKVPEYYLFCKKGFITS